MIDGELNEDIDDLLARNKYFFSVKVERLSELLSKIRPIKGNFLYFDIVGRIIWNATAISNSIQNLIKNNDDYGIKSLIRKLFECHILLEYLFQSQNRSKVIAKIMAYHLFNDDDYVNKVSREKLISIVKKIVEFYEEDIKIVEYYEKIYDRGKKHWSWTEMGFNKLIEKHFKTSSREEIGEMIVKNKKLLLNLFHTGTHIDLDLEEDFLEENDNNELVYVTPFRTSKRKLHSFIGLSIMIIDDIIQSTKDNLGID